MKRFWKSLVLALAAGGAFGFLVPVAKAAPSCKQICCPAGTWVDCQQPDGGGLRLTADLLSVSRGRTR